jgi:hypothetical protein
MNDLMERNIKEEDVERQVLVDQSTKYWRDINFLLAVSSPM